MRNFIGRQHAQPSKCLCMSLLISLEFIVITLAIPKMCVSISANGINNDVIAITQHLRRFKGDGYLPTLPTLINRFCR